MVAGTRIGSWALEAAGAVVSTDVPSYALVAGVPARRIGWVGRSGKCLVDAGAGNWTCAETGDRFVVRDELLCRIS